MDNETETQTAINAGLSLAGIVNLSGGVPLAFVPEGAIVEDLERLLVEPLRIRATPAFHDLASFVRYVKEFKLPATAIFAALTEKSVSFAAVIDYHAPDAPKRGTHRVVYACAASPEWLRWANKSSTEEALKPFTQAQFAQFIEDNMNDIIEPAGADVLEIARTLEAKQSVMFKGGIRQQNGDHSISYTSDTKGAGGGNGELAIPENFVLGIPPFVGGDLYKVTARLRYSIAEGCLKFRYELVRPHKIIEAACKDMVAKVETETGITPFMGNA